MLLFCKNGVNRSFVDLFFLLLVDTRPGLFQTVFKSHHLNKQSDDHKEMKGGNFLSMVQCFRPLIVLCFSARLYFLHSSHQLCYSSKVHLTCPQGAINSLQICVLRHCKMAEKVVLIGGNQEDHRFLWVKKPEALKEKDMISMLVAFK